MNIDYLLVAAVMDFHRTKYRQVEVPWMVSREAIMATIPADANPPFALSNPEGMYPIASAEQGFVQLMLDNKLGPGLYMAASPCFRSDVIDELHKREFFKLELIQITKLDLSPYTVNYFVDTMVQDAKGCFESFGSAPIIVETVIGKDLELNGIEIGSYGARTMGEWTWVYGTGIAEPRYTQATARTL